MKGTIRAKSISAARYECAFAGISRCTGVTKNGICEGHSKAVFQIGMK